MPEPDAEYGPYVGLRPFRESDGPYFFGRQRDIRIIASNVTASPLTVLYGPSGVGKSSVLQAGVVPHIRKADSAGILYFNEWQDASFLDSLSGKCQSAAGPFYLLLDQFEEYLMYHSGEEIQEKFEAMLARMINRDDGTVRILIGIREDALFRLDERMSLRVPNLLENTLQLKHLSAESAKEAIQEPIRVYNERVGLNGGGYRIEDRLVNGLLEQMQSGGRIETAFLQLVLSRIWTETAGNKSKVLSFDALKDLGGAQTIVDTHVKRVMTDALSSEQREVAARLFGYLVTPSRTKIAQSAADLISWSNAQETVVRQMLSNLTDRQDSRILRRLSNPERYELFHDVLAQPILDWLEEQKKLEEERRRDAETARQQRELEQAQAFSQAQQELAEAKEREAAAAQDLAAIRGRELEAVRRGRTRLLAALGGLMLATTGLLYFAWRSWRAEGEIAMILGQQIQLSKTGRIQSNRIDGLRYVYIPAGKFMMGCSPGDTECFDEEKPVHEVEITRAFWIGQTPVTQAAYEKVMKTNPSNFKGADKPVETVSWDDSKKYCEAVGLRLPTEAEWEYAARAGSKAARYGELDQIAWYSGNSKGQTQPLAAKYPNAWGLYDMLGNVWEWTADWYDKDYYKQNVLRDPPGPARSPENERVVRGGSWSYISSVRPRLGPCRGRAYGPGRPHRLSLCRGITLRV